MFLLRAHGNQHSKEMNKKLPKSIKFTLYCILKCSFPAVEKSTVTRTYTK